MIAPKHDTSRKESGRCESSEAIFRARLWASFRDQKTRVVALGKVCQLWASTNGKKTTQGVSTLVFWASLWVRYNNNKWKKKKMTSSPEGSHPKLQSIWVLVQNLNSQMPVVADRWQKFVSQERCNTKGGVTQREEVAWIGNHWPCLVILSFKCLGTQRKQTNKQMTPPLPVSDPFPGILFHLCVPITKPIPSCISAKQNHVIMSTIEGNTRSGLWSKIAMD